MGNADGCMSVISMPLLMDRSFNLRLHLSWWQLRDALTKDWFLLLKRALCLNFIIRCNITSTTVWPDTSKMDKKKNNNIFKTEWNQFGDRQTIIILFILLFYWRTNNNNIDKKKQQQPKNCAQPKKDKGWIWWWDFFRVIRFSLSNVTKISFESLFLECVHFVYKWLWSFFALWTHPNYVKISAGTSFHVSMICYQFSQIVFSFYCLLTIFPLFNLSLIQLLPQFATWFSLDLIASTCHLSVLIIYFWNASHKKKESQQHKKILMIIIYFYNFVLKFIYTL